MSEFMTALAMQGLLTAALLRGPWMRLHVALATGVALVGGALLAAVSFHIADITALPPFWSVGILVVAAVVLSEALRRRIPPLEGRSPEAVSDDVGYAHVWERLGCHGMWAAFGFILVVYLWSNAVQPPSLYEGTFPWTGEVHPLNLYGALFDWSDPARTSETVRGFAHSLSAFYYQYADSDLGWKFLWAVGGLLPWLVLFGGLRELGVRPILAVFGVAGPAASIAALFWGSTGHPDLFLSGCLLLLFFLAATPRALGRWLLPPAFLVLLWSGPLWIALGSLMVATGTVLRPAAPALHKLLGAGIAVVSLVYWAWATPLAWDVFGAFGAYLVWDAFNLARYGLMGYLILALLVRFAERSHLPAVLGGVVAPLFVAFLEVTSRQGMEFIRIDGSRLLTVGLILGWGVALVIMQTATTSAAEPPPREKETARRNGTVDLQSHVTGL